MVFNKIDAYNPEPYDETDLMITRSKIHYSLEEWKSTWMSKLGDNSLFISAISKENLEDFRARVYNEVRKFIFNVFLIIIFFILIMKENLK
jgi:GTP-binding protein HflX